MKRKMMIAIMLMALFAVCLSACSSKDEGKDSKDSGKILHVGWAKEIQTMDVHKTTDNYAIPLSVFDRLLEVELKDNGSTELVPSIAKEYSVSDDGLVYSFVLRDDVKFSDGTPLTSQDVEATFTRMFALPESVQTDYTTCIKGAQDILDGKADTLSGFHVTDDTHFEITLNEPFAGFLALLATPTCSIMSKKNLEEAGTDFGMVPEKTIGSGAYMVAEWKTFEGFKLVRNPNYWGEPGSADEVDIKIYPEAASMNMAFKNGDIDILDCDFLDSTTIESDYSGDEYRKVSVNRLGTYYIIMNQDIKPLKDPLVRKAMQMAVDRQSILDSIYGGRGSLVDGIYPAGSIGYNEDNQGWLTYDPEGAKKLLAQAGYKKGFKLELAADAAAPENVMNSLQIVQQNFSDIGIKAHIQNYDESSWLDLRKSGMMQCFSALWTLDYNDPSNIIEPFFGSAEAARGRSLNYKNKDVMKRVQKAKTIIDDDKRLAEYAELEKIIVNADAAWIPLFTLEHQFIINDRIEKFVPYWAGYSDFNVYGVTMK